LGCTRGTHRTQPRFDAISEAKLDHSSYSAEFGGRAGATINLMTKSGTRE